MWNQFWGFLKCKICHFNKFRGCEFWFLWYFWTFWRLKPTHKLISRKIWMTEKSWKSTLCCKSQMEHPEFTTSIQLQTSWIASKSNSANLVQFKRKLHPLALFTFLSSFFIPERSIASIALSKASWAWGMRHNSKRHLHCRIYNLYTMWVGYPASKARSISVRQSW